MSTKRDRIVRNVTGAFLGGNGYDAVDINLFEPAELDQLRLAVDEHLIAVRRFRARLDGVTATCVTCGVGFSPIRSDAEHCSAACRQRAYRQRRIEDLGGVL